MSAPNQSSASRSPGFELQNGNAASHWRPVIVLYSSRASRTTAGVWPRPRPGMPETVQLRTIQGAVTAAVAIRTSTIAVAVSRRRALSNSIRTQAARSTAASTYS